MDIVDNRKKGNIVKLSSLQNGDWFTYENSLYLVVDNDHIEYHEGEHRTILTFDCKEHKATIFQKEIVVVEVEPVYVQLHILRNK